MALSAVRPRAQPIDEERKSGRTRLRAGEEAPRKRRLRLFSPGKLIVLGSLIGLLAAFWLATRQVYFVGVDETGGDVVTLYHGCRTTFRSASSSTSRFVNRA